MRVRERLAKGEGARGFSFCVANFTYPPLRNFRGESLFEPWRFGRIESSDERETNEGMVESGAE